jgi:hypothetical protein
LLAEEEAAAESSDEALTLEEDVTAALYWSRPVPLVVRAFEAVWSVFRSPSKVCQAETSSLQVVI